MTPNLLKPLSDLHLLSYGEICQFAASSLFQLKKLSHVWILFLHFVLRCRSRKVPDSFSSPWRFNVSFTLLTSKASASKNRATRTRSFDLPVCNMIATRCSGLIT